MKKILFFILLILCTTLTFSQTTINNENVSTSNGFFSGNVGIGTDNPQYKLHIVSNTEFGQMIESSGADLFNRFNTSSGTGEYGIWNGALYFQSLDGLNGINFYGSSNEVANLHINPSGKIDIVSNEGTIASLFSTAGFDETVNFGNNINENNKAGVFGWDDYDSFVHINQYGDPSSTFTIQKGGNIGIGTTTSIAGLDVQTATIQAQKLYFDIVSEDYGGALTFTNNYDAVSKIDAQTYDSATITISSNLNENDQRSLDVDDSGNIIIYTGGDYNINSILNYERRGRTDIYTIDYLGSVYAYLNELSTTNVSDMPDFAPLQIYTPTINANGDITALNLKLQNMNAVAKQVPDITTETYLRDKILSKLDFSETAVSGYGVNPKSVSRDDIAYDNYAQSSNGYFYSVGNTENLFYVGGYENGGYTPIGIVQEHDGSGFWDSGSQPDSIETDIVAGEDGTYISFLIAEGMGAEGDITFTIKDNDNNVLATKTSYADYAFSTQVDFTPDDYSRLFNQGETIKIIYTMTGHSLMQKSSVSYSGTFFSYSNQQISATQYSQDNIIVSKTVKNENGTLTVNMPSQIRGSAKGLYCLATMNSFEAGDNITFDLLNGYNNNLCVSDAPLNSLVDLSNCDPTYNVIVVFKLHSLGQDATMGIPNLRSWGCAYLFDTNYPQGAYEVLP